MSKPNAKPSHRTQAEHPHPRLLTNGYVAVKQCRHGLMMYNLNDVCVGQSLDTYGEFFEHELSTLGQILRAGDVVVDVGANIGTHTLFFTQKVAPGGFVFAIEPQRITYEFLCANLALNRVVNAVPLRMAAGRVHGNIHVPVLDPNHENNFAALNVNGHSIGDIVEVKPLDDLQLQRCNLIKVDVEGMEFDVICGAEKTIRACRPFLFIENNSREGSPQTVQALVDLGYTCYWHIEATYNPANFFQSPKIGVSNYHEANMLCIPKEFNLNVTGFQPVADPNDTSIKALIRLGVLKE